jgi:integrase
MGAIQTLLQVGANPMAIKLQYTEAHRGGHRYRRVVPADCRKAIGKKRWYKTFPASVSLAMIERAVQILSLRHDAEIAKARGQDVEWAARDILADTPANRYWTLDAMHQGDMSARNKAIIATVEGGGKLPQESLTLSAAMAQDAARYGERRSEKPFTAAVDSFIATVGNKDILAITRNDVIEWITTKREDGWGGATIKRRLASLASMVGRTYLDSEIDRQNPFARHKVNGSNGSSKKRLPFNRAMLDRIDRYLSSDSRLGDDTRAILRIMKHTGTGPSEAGGLVLADVVLDGPVPFLWVRENSLRSPKVRGEDSARTRRLPLLGEALAAAQDAVARAKGRAGNKSPDHVALFPSFEAERGADQLSAKLNTAIRAAGIPRSPRLTAYSFRHTVKEAVRSAGVADHIQRRLLGHSGHGVADHYGATDSKLAELKTALESALKFLGDIDSSIYSETERLDV